MKKDILHEQETFSDPTGNVNKEKSSMTDISFTKIKGWVVLVISILIFTISGYSQPNFSLGVSGGYDHSFNFLKGLPKTNSDNFPDFNLGVSGILNLGDKVRVRAELGYENMNYTREWNFESQSPDRILNTVLSISNLDVSPRVDYKLVKAGKFDLYCSAGFRFEFTLGDFESTTKANGEKSTANFIENDYTKTQAGAVGGFIFKYNVNPSFGIILSPDYTYFFDKFSSKNDNNLQRVGVNLGVEWKF